MGFYSKITLVAASTLFLVLAALAIWGQVNNDINPGPPVHEGSKACVELCYSGSWLTRDLHENPNSYAFVEDGDLDGDKVFGIFYRKGGGSVRVEDKDGYGGRPGTRDLKGTFVGHRTCVRNADHCGSYSSHGSSGRSATEEEHEHEKINCLEADNPHCEGFAEDAVVQLGTALETREGRSLIPNGNSLTCLDWRDNTRWAHCRMKDVQSGDIVSCTDQNQNDSYGCIKSGVGDRRYEWHQNGFKLRGSNHVYWGSQVSDHR